jgi:hypothetical protein
MDDHMKSARCTVIIVINDDLIYYYADSMTPVYRHLDLEGRGSKFYETSVMYTTSTRWRGKWKIRLIYSYQQEMHSVETCYNYEKQTVVSDSTSLVSRHCRRFKLCGGTTVSRAYWFPTSRCAASPTSTCSLGTHAAYLPQILLKKPIMQRHTFFYIL